MFDDGFADRTLPPTDRRRREARQRGDVARSPELTAAAILFASSCALWIFAPQSLTVLSKCMQASLSTSQMTPPTIDSLCESVVTLIRIAATILGPILLVSVLTGLAANWIQTGWIWSPGLAVPRFRFGLSGIAGRLVNSAARLIQLAILCVVAWRFFSSHEWPLRNAGLVEPISMLVQPTRMLGELCIQLSLCLVLFAFVDYGLRFWRHELSLKMTVEERRREQMEDNTDPQVQRHRKLIAGKMSSQNRLAEIERTVSVGE